MKRLHFSVAFSVAMLIGVSKCPAADPVFQQLPLSRGQVSSQGAPFSGYAQPSQIGGSQNRWNGTVAADDFALTASTPVVSVRWWGYQDGTAEYYPSVTRALISFASDVPASQSIPFSHPGEVLNSQIVRSGPVSPGSGTFSGSLVYLGDPPLNEFYANLNFGKEFHPEPNKIYWISIMRLGETIPYTPWYWQDRDYGNLDAFAATAPAVTPGEYLAGTVPVGGTALPVYHFQEHALSGLADVMTSSTDPTFASVTLSGFAPRNYRWPNDGPSEIAQFPEDMAFELYTTYQVPDPRSIGVPGLALLTWMGFRRRRLIYLGR